MKAQSIFDAHDLYLSGRYGKALSVCEQLLARNPDSYSATNIIANIYLNQGDKPRGEVYLNKLKDYFLKRKKYDSALAVLKRLSELYPLKDTYPLEIAEIYRQSGREFLMQRKYLDIAELNRREGYFQKSADILVKLSGLYTGNFEMDRLIINRLALLGLKKDLAGVIKTKVLGRKLPREQRDDIILLCVDTGCCLEEIVPFLPDFLWAQPERLPLVEGLIVAHFTENRDDALLHDLGDAIGAEKIAPLIAKIREAAPENLPEETPLTEPEPEVVAEPETHTHEEDEPVVVEQIALDSFEPDDGVTHAAVELDGLEKFEEEAEPVEAAPPAGLESFDIEDARPSGDIFSAFDGSPQETVQDDIFAAFADAKPEKQAKEDVQQIDMSDITIEEPTEGKGKDIFDMEV